MLMEIPLIAVPSQELSLILGNQDCTLVIFTRGENLYLDLVVDDNPVIIGQLCNTQMFLVPYSYLPFKGNLYFIDIDGLDDPLYSGLGTRWRLFYDDGAV